MFRLGSLSKWIFLLACCALLFLPQIAAPALADDAADVLALVNQERTSRGIPPLTMCAVLNTVGQNHTDDMITRQFFAHTNPDGKDPGDRMTAAGYIWTWEGENIAVGYGTPEEVVEDAWMQSPGHRANILNPNFVHMGLGTAVGNYMGFNERYWTQDFGAGGSCGGQSVDLAVTLTDTPDPVSVGRNLTYTIHVSNSGVMGASKTAITQQLPANVAYVSATPTQGNCSNTGSILSCDLGVINASGSATVTVVVTPSTVGTISSKVSVASPSDYDANTSNNVVSATTTVAPPPPAAPTLTAPLGTIAVLQPVFSWSAPSGAVRYEIQIGTTNPPATTPISITTNKYTPPAPMLIGNYFWQVRAFNAAGVPSDNWSSVGSFTLNSPDGSAPLTGYFTTSPVTLTWNRIIGATGYDIEIADNPAMDNPIVQASTSALFYSTSALTSNTYYWQVRGKNGSTVGAWSTPQIFIRK